MKGHLRKFIAAVLESAVILAVMSALYLLGYLLVCQEMPAWK